MNIMEYLQKIIRKEASSIQNGKAKKQKQSKSLKYTKLHAKIVIKFAMCAIQKVRRRYLLL